MNTFPGKTKFSLRHSYAMVTVIVICCTSAIIISQNQAQSKLESHGPTVSTRENSSNRANNFLARMWGWTQRNNSNTNKQNVELRLAAHTEKLDAAIALEPIPDEFPHTGIMSVNSQDDRSRELQQNTNSEAAIPLNPYQIEQELLSKGKTPTLALPPAPAPPLTEADRTEADKLELTIAEPVKAPLPEKRTVIATEPELPASSPVIPPAPVPVAEQKRPNIELKPKAPKELKVPVVKSAPVKPEPIPEVPVIKHPYSIPAYSPEATFGHQPAFPGYDPFATYGPSRVRCGVHCATGCRCEEKRWKDAQTIPWEIFAQGEYVGPARLRHVPEYRLRVDDIVDFVYRLKGEKSALPYRLNVGDFIRIESLTDETLNREVIVQPDGSITVRLLGQITASDRTITELTDDLNNKYKKLVKQPAITVTPIRLNTKLEELRSTVDRRAGAGGQSRSTRVTPEGTIQLPAIGSVPAQGLTLTELKLEIERRYNQLVPGLEVTPILTDRAPRFIYVTGEVAAPGRYDLVAPTTVIQAIALAGSWNIGADLRNVVILRRDENWQLMATKVNLFKALFGKRPCPEGELWLRDSDIIILPKSKIQWTGDLIELIFTRVIYGVVPLSYNVNFARLNTL